MVYEDSYGNRVYPSLREAKPFMALSRALDRDEITFEEYRAQVARLERCELGAAP